MDISGIKAGAVSTGQSHALPAPFAHIVMCIMENRGVPEIYQNAAAPYINNTLIPGGCYFNNYFAIEHPSQPDYLDLFSGSNQGCTDDAEPPAGSPYSTPNLASLLIAAGKTFLGYYDSMPSVDYAGGSFGNYTRSHNFSISFSNISGVSVPFTQWPASNNYASLPTVAYVSPDLTHDMHTPSNVPAGDAWLQANMDPYVQWAKTNNSLFILVWDEAEGQYAANNQVAMFMAGAHLNPGIYAEKLNHYNLLKTILKIHGLADCGNTGTVTSILDCWA